MPRKPAAKKTEIEKHDIVQVATLKPGELQELIAAPATEEPAKKTRKPRTKTTEKKAEPVFSTIVQAGDAEYDISDVTERAYKSYKASHKRKTVTDFRVYVKPEEGVAYYTVNGEGFPDFKIEL